MSTPYTAAELAERRDAVRDLVNAGHPFATSFMRLLATADAAEARDRTRRRALEMIVSGLSEWDSDQLQNWIASYAVPACGDAPTFRGDELPARAVALSAPVQAGETREQAVEACARAGWEASSTRHMEPFDADWLANARDVIDERAPEGADRWESAFATAVLREAARHPILATGASKERK